MCGRVRGPGEWVELRSDWKIKWGEIRDGGKRYNVPPTSVLNVVRSEPKRGRGIEPMRWGLIPAWSKEFKSKFATFNARLETVQTAASYRGAWKAGRRCLLPVDGYYEWRESDKQPFAIELANRSTMALGGLWEAWKPKDGEEQHSFTLITMDAGDSLGGIHDRVPAILDAETWPAWLGEEKASNDDILAMLKPIAKQRLKIWPVSKAVGNVKNEGPELVEPIAL